MTTRRSVASLDALEQRLRWLTAIRVLVIASMALPYMLLYQSVWSNLNEPELMGPTRPGEVLSSPVEEELSLKDRQRRLFRHLVAVVSAQTLLYIVLMRVLAHRQVLQAYVQFAGDLLLISLVILELGESGSFSILYLVVISVASVLLRRSAGIIIASVAYVLYASVTLGLTYGWFRSIPEIGISPPVSDRVTAVPLTYDLGVHLVGFYAVALFTSYLARDVTRAEEELQEKRLDLAELQVMHRDVIQSISSGLLTMDFDGRITSANQAAEEILGRSEEDMVGHTVDSTGLLVEDHWGRRDEISVRDGGRHRNEISIERGGEVLHLGYTLTPLRDGRGAPQGYILIFQDLTDWKAMQERLRIQDRMAAIGEMAAGLAHEIGNPLAAISGSVQMLSANFEDEPSQRKLLEITLKESLRLDRTVKGFLQFARPREREAVKMDIAALLREETELLRNDAEIRRSRIDLELSVPRGSSEIHADPDQISQIFWNLARNALKAMPEGGRLRISGEKRTDGRYRIVFEDTGSGMSEEERARLFHPFKSFFDDGTGIGMSIVYRIVEEHHGEIDVQSAPGRGTAITIHLPTEILPSETFATKEKVDR